MVRSFDHGSEQEPGFAWIAAQRAGSKNLAQPGSQPDNELWLNYYGRLGSLRSFSFGEVVGKSSQPKGYFKGENVFVGSLPGVKYGQEITDEYRFPYSRWTQERISGVAIAATAFANLMRGDSLRYLGYQNQGAHLILLFAGAALFGCGLVWLRPWWAVGASTASAVAIAWFSCIWVWKSHVWLNWMLISGMQIPATGWSGWSVNRR